MTAGWRALEDLDCPLPAPLTARRLMPCFGCRMESTGLPNRVHVSSATHGLLLGQEQYRWECRGETAVKGIGAMETFLLQNEA